jgi:hypothetical protein
MRNLSFLMILVWLYGITAWIVNLVMLLNCNFAGPWRDEIVHGIGLIGPIAMITVWM